MCLHNETAGGMVKMNLQIPVIYSFYVLHLKFNIFLSTSYILICNK